MPGLKNKEIIKNMLIAFLATLAIFSAFRYISALKEQCLLTDGIREANEQVAVLENQNQNLLQQLEKEKAAQEELIQKNSQLKDILAASKDRLAGLFKDATTLNSQVALLKAENTALTEQREKLKAQLAQSHQENEQLNEKLNSIAELKKAIRQIKKKMHTVATKIQETANKKEIIVEGNRGFIIKDGEAIYPAKVKIEVAPANLTE